MIKLTNKSDVKRTFHVEYNEEQNISFILFLREKEATFEDYD